ncbi:bioD-like N-terminal domain of phosphotransacetylase [Rubidibacter lacunae KORDI 51-2]|uniref:BioD-like N-terminal domain of phosphotransacetylase n=1 Tax=Rubidibacter lacunae KORDI 51-2 TaxID=582515 RepID=U5DEH7_9CHRO|nr:phosphotransacetylase family protein [Rubidibacter lacunae]ERN40021.1 bioD-like N-terminal domain of phosphotransacetylase [Rubidibacter lacunae KORDI 51-2]
MAQSARVLLIGSTEAHTGKSALVLGAANQLRDRGIPIAYSKPLGSFVEPKSVDSLLEEDVQLVATMLDLPPGRVGQPIAYFDERTFDRAFQEGSDRDLRQQLCASVRSLAAELVLVEAPATLTEGKLFELTTEQMAEALDASVLLVVRGRSPRSVDAVLAAKEQLGERLVGVSINSVPDSQRCLMAESVRPYLERHGIPVFGLLPSSELLESVSVREIANQLGARVLCCANRLDLMVENLTIGAMNVNSALRYFRKGRNLAVITGGDRSDLQLAAMETSAHCLILTGQVDPQEFILQRAEALEVPILNVDLDTLTTVQIVERVFARARIQEPIKVDCVRELMSEHFDLDRLLDAIQFNAPIST